MEGIVMASYEFPHEIKPNSDWLYFTFHNACTLKTGKILKRFVKLTLKSFNMEDFKSKAYSCANFQDHFYLLGTQKILILNIQILTYFYTYIYMFMTSGV